MPDSTTRDPQSPLITADVLRKLGHELRSPLSTIKGYATVLEEELSEFENVPPTLREFARIIRLSAERGLLEIPSLVELLKIGTGNLELSLSAVSVNEIVENVVHRHREHILSAGLELHVEQAANQPIVLAERDALMRVTEELLLNALRFTPEGTIIIRTGNTPEAALIQIEDTGIGFDENEANRIFEPFVQLSASSNDVYDHHSGLGLALAKELISLMNGRIYATSTLGSGSRFTIELKPCAASDSF